MSKPTLRRLNDLTPAEQIQRNVNRTQLGRIEKLKESTQCRKPVWVSCFLDGTGNNFSEDGGGKPDPIFVKYSNVAKLAIFAHPDEDVVKQTYTIYAPGVGTPFPAVNDSGGGIEKAGGMASAVKGQARISWMLEQLKSRIDDHMPHVNQVNVAVFGFSRGAAQARAFVLQLASQCGRYKDELIWTRSGGSIPPRLVVYFLGIFDTVASVGFGGSRFESSLKYRLLSVPLVGPGLGIFAYALDSGGHADWAADLHIPSYVRACEHYVAAHEVREKFPSDSVRANRVLPVNCKETFYPGAHSDVGGGYDDMNQEGRSNELSRIPLCNMFLAAYVAGVPFNPPADILKSRYGALFEITAPLQSCFQGYIDLITPQNSLEKQVMSHMNAYYHWRWGRTERQSVARKERAAMVSKGQSVMYATPDVFMTQTDSEWEEDVKNIAEKKTGFFRGTTEPLEDVIFDAWKGTMRKSMPAGKAVLFDKFFDYYVHDSIAGFKHDMAASHIGSIEESRWSKNRQYFMGKRGKKFLYWKYVGIKPETDALKEAMLMPKEPDQDSKTAIV